MTVTTMNSPMSKAARVAHLANVEAALLRRHAEATTAEQTGRAEMAQLLAKGETFPGDWAARSAQPKAEMDALVDALKLTRAELRSAKAQITLAVTKLRVNRREPLERKAEDLRGEYAILEQRFSGRTIQGRVSLADFREQSAAIDAELARIATAIADVDREIDAVGAV